MKREILNLAKMLFVMGTFLLVTSCSTDMLKEEPYTNASQVSIKEQGVAGCQALVNGIYKYNKYFGPKGGNNWMMGTLTGTDEFVLNWGFNIGEWGGQQNFLNVDSGHYQPMEMYREVYKLIAQSNEVIVTFGDKATDPEYATMVAEAKFWRAYAYYKLQNAYGAIPLLKGGEDISAGIAKTPIVDIQTFVESEMKGIENTLPAKATTFGRPTKYAVKSFLARFYLNQKKWQQASDYAKDVINNSGASLMSNYADVFAKDENSEIILAITFLAQPGKGNLYVALSLESNLRAALGISGVSASNGYGMSNYFYNTFASNDLRIAPFNKTTKKGIAVAGIQYQADGVTSVYTNADGTPKTVQKALNRVITFKYPLQENIPTGENADADYPLMRLGETYLTYAEALFQLGNTTEALKYINPLRNRAGLTDLSTLTIADILKERGWETYHEGYRREDLIRYGELMNSVEKKYLFDFGGTYPNKGQTWRELEPIPLDAMVLNPKLVQNTGY